MQIRARLLAALSASAGAALALAILALPAATSRAEKSDAAIGADAPICRGAPGDSSYYSEVALANARMHHAMHAAPGGDVDADFTRTMIAHHQGAIDMARALLKYGHDEKLKRLAQSIVVEQTQEIAYMRMLLDAAPAASASPQHPNP